MQSSIASWSFAGAAERAAVRGAVAYSARRANHFGLPESCQVSQAKIFCFTEMAIGFITCPSPRHHEGTLAQSSRNVCAGCDGRSLRQQGANRADENAAAYGEVVWSWRRDPGVYPLRLCGDGNGDNKGRSPGRARISRKPLRGESRDVLAVPVVSTRALCLLSFRTRATGAVGARLSLRPLFKRGTTKLQKPGQILSRERGRLSSPLFNVIV